MRKFIKVLFSPITIIALLLVVQAVVLVGMFWKLQKYFTFYYAILTLVSLLVVLYIIVRPDNPAIKLAWCVPILLVPVFGGILYLFVSLQKGPRRFKKDLNEIMKEQAQVLKQNPEVMEALKPIDKGAYNNITYMNRFAGAVAVSDTAASFFPVGEDKWADMIKELEKAEKYIYLEYFIIGEGEFWDSILEVLAKKAAQGVDVRVMYDGMGCLMTLPYNYPKKLKAMGIQAQVFFPFAPFLSVMQNNRDHRKILVIDGKVAYNGGINLADEYINKKKPFGHWKDTAVKLTGKAVLPFTFLFLQNWQLLTKQSVDYAAYLQDVDCTVQEKGLVMPFGDAPLDCENVGEYMYMDMLNRSVNYVYITSPYLIIDNEMSIAMQSAAKRGVDVRLIVPHVADHWYAAWVAKSFYAELIGAGVKLYEYTPGFIHAKEFICDDQSAIVGTINLDYRSLYLHFECGTWFYEHPVIEDIKEDFLQTQQQSQLMTVESARGKSMFTSKLLACILRLFAPLM